MIRFKVEILINGIWMECKLAKLAASLEPGNYGTFATKAAAEGFTKEWPRREAVKESFRVVEVKVGK